MSNEALAWAWKVDGLTSVQKFLLVALADFADESHSCFPGQVRLAAMVGVKREAVSRNLTSLENAGLISRSRRNLPTGARTSDRFTLAVGANIQCARNARTPEEGSMCAKTEANVRETGGVIGTPSNNHQENHQIRAQEQPHDPALFFEDWWSVYPLKKDKGTARRAFLKASKKVSVEILISAASSYRDDPNRDPQFTKYPASWLNAEAWENGPLPQRRQSGGSAVESMLERMRNRPEVGGERDAIGA